MEDTPESVLMDRAAQGLAEHCVALLTRAGIEPTGARVVVLVGSGNNGGDALLAGALLADAGVAVTAVGVGPTAHRRGLATLTEAGGRWHDANDDAGLQGAREVLATAALVIDGIVGIGSKPGLREPAVGLVGVIGRHTPVLAVDVPSGLDADSGALPRTYVAADVTVTFTALKPCLVLEPARKVAGKIIVVNVGVKRDA